MLINVSALFSDLKDRNEILFVCEVKLMMDSVMSLITTKNVPRIVMLELRFFVGLLF